MVGFLVAAFLLLLGNLVFFITWRLTPKPKFKENKHYSEKSIKRQQEVKINHKKMIRNRFILINSVPLAMFFITIIVILIDIDSLSELWNLLSQVTGFFAMTFYMLWGDTHGIRNSGADYEIMPDGSVKIEKTDKILTYLFSFAIIIAWIVFTIIICVKHFGG